MITTLSLLLILVPLSRSMLIWAPRICSFFFLQGVVWTALEEEKRKAEKMHEF
jgi:hypothetical protein